jgi:hypothetical protein
VLIFLTVRLIADPLQDSNDIPRQPCTLLGLPVGLCMVQMKCAE